jgi:hypothetical protein
MGDELGLEEGCVNGAFDGCGVMGDELGLAVGCADGAFDGCGVMGDELGLTVTGPAITSTGSATFASCNAPQLSPSHSAAFCINFSV